MRPVSTAAQLRALDAAVIDGLGLPGVALMELASRGVAEVVRRLSPDGPVLVLCGPGNNGGDGWAVARWLHAWGLDVAVWAPTEPRSEDASTMAQVTRKAGVPVVTELGDPVLVVDALLGTGLSRPVGGAYAEPLGKLAGRPCVAVDLPSGLNGDTGEAMGDVLQAVVTVTFGREKLGMFLRDGPRLCGRVEVVDIGLGAATPPEAQRAAWVMESSDVVAPPRARDAHKRRMGDVLVVAGSTAMAGAAVLACEGVLAAGVGLVRLLAPRGALPRLARLPPEVMWVHGGEGDVVDALPPAAALTSHDAVLAGPGLGRGDPLPDGVQATLRSWWADADTTLVFDADALLCTAPVEVARRAHRILTPHEGEAARLLSCPVPDVSRRRLEAATALSRRGVALLKGPETLVATSDDDVSIDPSGHPVLATGGSGDVLAGFIAGLAARGLGGSAAARTGAFRHGQAGERLAARRTDGWSASDLPAELRRGWAPPTSGGT